MKKLLFFAILLFGILSVQSLADAFGCGVTVPLEVCQNPGGTQNSAPKITYYGGIAINPRTRSFYSSWNYRNGEDAEAAALKGCGGSNSCISTWASSAYMAIAISEDEKSWGYGSSNDHGEAWDKAVAMCQKSKKICHVALIGYPNKEAVYVYWGGVAYNPHTGSTGKTSDELRDIDAEESVAKQTGCDGDDKCYFYTFQYGYGALAKGESNRVYSGSSNKSLKDAEKEAEKKCKKDSGDKQCKAIVSAAKRTKK